MAKVKVKAKPQDNPEEALQRIENLLGTHTPKAKSRRASVYEEVDDLRAIINHQREEIRVLLARVEDVEHEHNMLVELWNAHQEAHNA